MFGGFVVSNGRLKWSCRFVPCLIWGHWTEYRSVANVYWTVIKQLINNISTYPIFIQYNFKLTWTSILTSKPWLFTLVKSHHSMIYTIYVSLKRLINDMTYTSVWSWPKNGFHSSKKSLSASPILSRFDSQSLIVHEVCDSYTIGSVYSQHPMPLHL